MTISERHHRYAGFRQTIKTVGTGPHGSRALSFDEAREAMHRLLGGEVTPAQAGAFLTSLRIKGETPEELAGLAQGLRDAAPALRAGTDRPLVSCAGAFDGVADSPLLSIAAAVTAAACGAGVVLACGDRLGPKYGTTVADVLAALGGPAEPTIAESEAMLARAGVTVLHMGVAVEGWRALAELRDEIGLRGPVHSAEKLIGGFGAERFVIGHTHSPYAERFIGALRRLGAVRAVAVRGIEGSDVLRPGRPIAQAATGSDTPTRLELPELLGARLSGDGGTEASAWITRVLVRGEADDLLTHTVALSAGVTLYAAGCFEEPLAAARAARVALSDGRAAAVLEALIG